MQNKTRAPPVRMPRWALAFLVPLVIVPSVLAASPSALPQRSGPTTAPPAGFRLRTGCAFIDPNPTRTTPVPPYLRASSVPPLLAGPPDDGGGAADGRDGRGGGGAEQRQVKVGSSDYYEGFVSRSVNEEPADRVTGDKVLGPTLKLAGGAAAVLVLLTVGFLVSNGII